MGNKAPKEIEKEDYENCCNTFVDYFIKAKNELEVEEEKRKKDIYNKFDECLKKNIIFELIKHFLIIKKKKKY